MQISRATNAGNQPGVVSKALTYIIGGLLAAQDQNIRNGATSMLKRSARDLTESQFNAAKALVTEAPEQSLLGKLFGGKSAAFIPDPYVKDLT